MARKKGSPKYGGRDKGTPNRTTKQARELMNAILFGEIDHIKSALDEIRQWDPGRYLDILSKLMAYSLPRKTDVTTDDEPLKAVTISALSTAEQKQIQEAMLKIDEHKNT